MRGSPCGIISAWKDVKWRECHQYGSTPWLPDWKPERGRQCAHACASILILSSVWVWPHYHILVPDTYFSADAIPMTSRKLLCLQFWIGTSEAISFLERVSTRFSACQSAVGRSWVQINPINCIYNRNILSIGSIFIENSYTAIIIWSVDWNVQTYQRYG